MDVLNEANHFEKQTQSPLSAALQQARINLKAIGKVINLFFDEIMVIKVVLLLKLLMYLSNIRRTHFSISLNVCISA